MEMYIIGYLDIIFRMEYKMFFKIMEGFSLVEFSIYMILGFIIFMIVMVD